MNNRNQWNTLQRSERSSDLSTFFSFAILLVFVLSQNADWGNNRLLWWGSIGLFLVTFFMSHGGSLSLEQNYTLWIIAFFGICAISYLWAVNTSLVVSTLKSMVVHVAVLLLLRSSIKSENNVERVLKIVLLSVVINVVWLLLTNRSMFEETGGKTEVIDRLGTEGSWNANSVGMMAAIAMLIALYFQKKNKSVLLKALCLGVMALMILVALLSGSRKAILMVFIGLCGFIFVSSKGKRIRATLLIVGVVLALLYVVMEVPFFYSIIGWRMEGFWASLTGSGTVDSSAQIRNEFVKDAIRAWREKPFFGHGLDCYRAVNKVELGMYAHNNYVELLADLGVIGTSIYYSAYAYCLVKLIKIKQKTPLVWLFIIFEGIFLVMHYGNVSYKSFLNEIFLMLMFSTISIYQNHR